MKWTNQHVVTESSGHHITDETSVDETYMDTTIMHRYNNIHLNSWETVPFKQQIAIPHNKNLIN